MTKGKRRSVDPAKLRHVAELVTKRLKEEGVPHALIGGVAVGEHGYMRATEDVDFLVTQEDLSKLTGRPLTVGMTETVEGVGVDFISTDPDEEFLEEAIHAAKGTPPLIPLPALVYLKLKVNRRRDQGDVVELVKRGAVDVREVRLYLMRVGGMDLVQEFDLLVLTAEREED